jgi:DnaJ like chaperone protein
MSIFGKLAGAAAGMALGGPIGALLGGLAGHYAFDKRDEEVAPESRTARGQIAFTIGVIALGAKMAKADGVVTRNEVDAFKQIFHVPPGEFQNVRRIFNLAHQSIAGYDGYARQIATMFRDNPGVLEDLLDGLFHIAKADGVIHPNEIEYLENVAEIFGYSPGEFDRIRASHLGPEESDPYLILGIDRSISDSDLKKAYRRMVRENHPDAFVGRGVPEEFIRLANDKLAAINEAYDRIAKERGLT